MNSPPQHWEDRLLADAFAEDWSTEAVSASATSAARLVRFRRYRRRLALAATAVVLAVAGSIAVHPFSRRKPAAAPVATAASGKEKIPAAARPGYEIISDAELLNALRDRRFMILPDACGAQVIVWLDRSSS